MKLSPAWAFAASLLGSSLVLAHPMKRVAHDGRLPGYQSLMMTLPRQGFGYVAMVNGDAPVPATDLFACYQAAATETVGNRLPAPSLPPIRRSSVIDSGITSGLSSIGPILAVVTCSA